MRKVVYLTFLTLFTGALAYQDGDFNKITNKQRLRQHFVNTLTASESDLKSLPVVKHDVDEDDIPEFFDARTQWPQCETIREVADQSACASDWAISVASVISDRICIHSNGTLQPKISARNLLACDQVSYGCRGGIPLHAFRYWIDNGLVTGGPYESKIGCQPYPYPPCAHYSTNETSKSDCPYRHYRTPDCTNTCDNSSIIFKNDQYFGKSVYRVENDVIQIQKEIMTNGPVVSVLVIYSDFFSYKNGVYMKTSNEMQGTQAVKLIGWGVENDMKYWLAVNSWDEDWGDEGLIKIRRGVNELDLEYQVYAGLPSDAL